MSFKVIETQEDFDAAIQDRLSRQESTIRKEYAGFLSPEDEKKKYEGYLSQADVEAKYKGYLSPEEVAKKDSVIKNYEKEALKVKVAHEKGIPYELASRLSGNTEEEMGKDADVIAGFIKSGNPYPEHNPNPKPNSKDAAYKNLLSNLKGD